MDLKDYETEIKKNKAVIASLESKLKILEGNRKRISEDEYIKNLSNINRLLKAEKEKLAYNEASIKAISGYIKNHGLENNTHSDGIFNRIKVDPEDSEFILSEDKQEELVLLLEKYLCLVDGMKKYMENMNLVDYALKSFDNIKSLLSPENQKKLENHKKPTNEYLMSHGETEFYLKSFNELTNKISNLISPSLLKRAGVKEIEIYEPEKLDDDEPIQEKKAPQVDNPSVEPEPNVLAETNKEKLDEIYNLIKWCVDSCPQRLDFIEDLISKLKVYSENLGIDYKDKIAALIDTLNHRINLGNDTFDRSFTEKKEEIKVKLAEIDSKINELKPTEEIEQDVNTGEKEKLLDSIFILPYCSDTLKEKYIKEINDKYDMLDEKSKEEVLNGIKDKKLEESFPKLFPDYVRKNDLNTPQVNNPSVEPEPNVSEETNKEKLDEIYNLIKWCVDSCPQSLGFIEDLISKLKVYSENLGIDYKDKIAALIDTLNHRINLGNDIFDRNFTEKKEEIKARLAEIDSKINELKPTEEIEQDVNTGTKDELLDLILILPYCSDTLKEKFIKEINDKYTTLDEKSKEEVLNGIKDKKLEESFPKLFPNYNHQNSLNEASGNKDDDKDKKDETKGFLGVPLEVLPTNEPMQVKSVKKHKFNKKKVLIALGLAALAISVAVGLQAIIPTVLSSRMVFNSKLWHTASEVEKNFLHTKNIELANVISKITGKSTAFNSGNGIWKLGSTELLDFSKNMSSKFISSLAVGGLSIAGLSLGLKKSEEYKNIMKSIKDADLIEGDSKRKYLENLSTKVPSAKLSNNEERKLLTVLQNKLKGLRKEQEPKKEGENSPEMNSERYHYYKDQIAKIFKGEANTSIEELGRNIENDPNLAKYGKDALIGYLNIMINRQNKLNSEGSRGR